MTYRFVPQNWLRALQAATLAVTATAGLSVILLPPEDPKLTVVERSMSGRPWGAALLVASMVALACEAVMWRIKDDRLVPVVSYCHIILCGALFGLSTAALMGVLERSPGNFMAPALGVYLAFVHMVFVKRRPRA